MQGYQLVLNNVQRGLSQGVYKSWAVYIGSRLLQGLLHALLNEESGSATGRRYRNGHEPPPSRPGRASQP